MKAARVRRSRRDDAREAARDPIEAAARLLAVPSVTARASLAYCHLPGPIEALLVLYACEEWQRWPVVESAVVQLLPPSWAAGRAANDAMQRILWRVAEISQDQRARELGIRADRYRDLTRMAEGVLRGWLWLGSVIYLCAVDGRIRTPESAPLH